VQKIFEKRDECMSNQPITIREYLTEVETYKYSTEYFDTMKVIGELKLMDIFTDASEYIAENRGLSIKLSDTLITEASCSDIISKLNDGYREKSGVIRKTILTRAKKSWGAINTFLSQASMITHDKQDARLVQLCGKLRGIDTTTISKLLNDKNYVLKLDDILRRWSSHVSEKNKYSNKHLYKIRVLRWV